MSSKLMKYVSFILVLSSAFCISAQSGYLEVLNKWDQFEELSTSDFNEGLSSYSKTVLVSYSLKEDKVYFIDSKTYSLHYDFCKAELEYSGGHLEFNNKEYTSFNKREYVNFKLVYHGYLECFTIENYLEEEILSGLLSKSFLRIKEGIGITDSVFYMPLSPSLTRIATKEELPIKTIDQILGGKKFKALNTSKAQGVLRIVGEDYSWSEIQSTDIVVITTPNNNMPPNSGIISTFYQPYLSHLNVLSRQRSVPNMMFLNAMYDSLLMSFVGEYVELEVKKDTFLIKRVVSDQVTIDTVLKTLDANDDLKEVLPIRKVNEGIVHSIGRKAANFSELVKIEGVRTPEGAFVIPFYFYKNHIIRAGLEKLIDSLHTNLEKANEESVLKEIRERIKAQEIDSNLLSTVAGLCAKDKHAYRFRSSSNCEDLENFNGAGLYKSVTGDNSTTEKTYERAIKKVWASLWSYRAYYERKIAQINQNSVRMGILVHRSFPKEEASGIALTYNPFSEVKTGFYINITPDNYRVANQKDTVDRVVEFLMYSDFVIGQLLDVRVLKSNNSLVLNNLNFVQLHNVLIRISKHFGKIYNDLEIQFEVEFKIDNGKLYIKQVRPY